MARTRTTRGKKDEIHIRMYRRFLGDCFLLTFPSDSRKPFHMMIDCGVILGTKDPEKIMTGVVSDIIKTTGGVVDLLVVTHEHWDHLSGFLQASDLFEEGTNAGDDGGRTDGKLRIQNLWLAWTEDPRDELATMLRQQRAKAEQGLRLALQPLRAAEADERMSSPDEGQSGWAWSDQVESLLGFFGARSGSTAEALQAVQRYARNMPRYCRPSDTPIVLDETPGIRFYVMGPPEEEKLLKKSLPSKAHPEVYEAAFSATPANAFLAAVLAGNEEFVEGSESSQPFDGACRVPLVQAQQLPFFRRRYWENAEDEDFTDQGWRRIDADWAAAAASLALKLDQDTNNTSLALAIELTENGQVLLFPGDAQVGNWLSWGDLSWDVDGKKVGGLDLLGRTIFYKVGHHGSHNATLRDRGLELMNDPELVAFVPVDHQMAVKKRWNKIPFEPLLTRLKEKTLGRTIRGDDPEPVAKRPRPSDISEIAWQSFSNRVRETELYVEYSIPFTKP